MGRSANTTGRRQGSPQAPRRKSKSSEYGWLIICSAARTTPGRSSNARRCVRMIEQDGLAKQAR